MDISLELKGLPCLNKVYLLTYLLKYNFYTARNLYNIENSELLRSRLNRDLVNVVFIYQREVHNTVKRQEMCLNGVFAFWTSNN